MPSYGQPSPFFSSEDWIDAPPGPPPTSLLIGGALANTGFYLIIVGAIMFGWQFTRGMIRTARGRCFGCGYLVMHSDADRCSECGMLSI